jgi:hypothetical protein
MVDRRRRAVTFLPHLHPDELLRQDVAVEFLPHLHPDEHLRQDVAVEFPRRLRLDALLRQDVAVECLLHLLLDELLHQDAPVVVCLHHRHLDDFLRRQDAACPHLRPPDACQECSRRDLPFPACRPIRASRLVEIHRDGRARMLPPPRPLSHRPLSRRRPTLRRVACLGARHRADRHRQDQESFRVARH